MLTGVMAVMMVVMMTMMMAMVMTVMVRLMKTMITMIPTFFFRWHSFPGVGADLLECPIGSHDPLYWGRKRHLTPEQIEMFHRMRAGIWEGHQKWNSVREG